MTVGIKDVALAAGVSPATVSRALGNGPVSAELRRKVEAAVIATGYRPNLAARQLRSQKSMTVGLIVADIRNPFFTSLARAVETAAYEAGMRVLLCNTDETPEREAMYLQLMAEERVSGLILAPTRALDRSLLAAFDRPAILVDRDLPGSGRDSVVLDNRAAAALLVDHLVASGRQRIAGLFGATSATGAERRAGFEAAMARHDLEPLVRQVAPNLNAGRDALDEICREAPEAVVLSNGLFLGAMLGLCHERNLAIPGDIAVAGFDDEPWTSFVTPGITVIRQPVDAFGHEAMRMLLARLAAPAEPQRSVILSGQLITRGSTAAL